MNQLHNHCGFFRKTKLIDAHFLRESDALALLFLHEVL